MCLLDVIVANAESIAEQEYPRSDLENSRRHFKLNILIVNEKEAKKEAFRKYLESSGVLDALTKVLVALYEEHDKPAFAVEFIQQKLGGPSISEYEKLQAEKSDLQLKYDDLLASYKEKCKELEDLKSSKTNSHMDRLEDTEK
ncbi:hypothetical protein AXF42_Ash019388 [Apostasia shenzhenica]|uniref:Uncharacterized protein n=1 Tax=Apostasia shenzhenica TaxID=1088818 RepID=A0A2I0B4S2_9ASPA|nr:hypothetical protein AXF42_Ash019388 [Apostasia shenzhenica]